MWRLPAGQREKQRERYAGVSHIDAERVIEDDTYAQHILEYAGKRKVEISSLAYYPNTMDADPEKEMPGSLSFKGIDTGKCKNLVWEWLRHL